MGEPGTIFPLAINIVRNEGTTQTACAFTGEMFDPQTGLVFLRARYLDVSDGRLLSRDTWTGDANMPMSYNAWLYGYANSIVNTDPDGHKVKRVGDKSINTNDFVYYCNYGWIDLGHANPDMALGIFMDFQETRETLQWFAFWGGSYFSEEDLTSDLIGFYLATSGKKSLRIKDGNDTFIWLAKICDYPEDREEAKQWSLDVYNEHGRSVEGWREWASPRLKSCPSIDSECASKPRSWPTEFSINSAVKPQFDDDWWFYHPWVDGDLIPTGID